MDQDLTRSSAKIKALTATTGDLNDPGRLEFKQRDDDHKLATFFINKRTGFSIYLMALLVIVCVVAVLALISFLFLFWRPRRYGDKKANANSSRTSDDKILVLPHKDFKLVFF